MAFSYFIFSMIMNYMKASGVEVYILKVEPKKGRILFEHIVDDGEKGDINIEREIKRHD